MTDINYINVQTASGLLDRNEAIIVDVRDHNEFKEEHMTGAVLNPLSAFSATKLDDMRGDRKVIFYCKTGKRALMALDRYMHEGLMDEELYILEGHLPAWKKAGLTIEKNSDVISLERQVMSITGSLILLGVLFSVLISPSWIWLSGFVGAGLLFAGLSGSCMLKRILMMMPFNQEESSP